MFPTTEQALRREYGITVSCCPSCHEDLDQGYIGHMCVIEWPDGTDVEVCCAVKQEYDRINKHKE